jgi:5-methylcytosine-specific restriction endonuclease McrA
MSQSNSNTALILRELRTNVGIVEVAQRPTDGYINITQIAQAVGKDVFDWKRSDGVKEYLEELSLETGISVSKLLQNIRGRGDRVKQATWAHPQPALKCAAWSDKRFEVQVWKWIDELRTTGVVDIRKEPTNPLQRLSLATNEAIAYLAETKADKALVMQLYDAHGQLVLRCDGMEKDAVHMRDDMQHGFGKVEKRFELNRKAALDRACRTAPKGHQMWWWNIAGGRCINPRCRVALDELSPIYAHNHPVFDELIPVTDGGRRCIANIQLICYGCNSKKSAKWTDYRPPQVIAQAYQADSEGARYHAELRHKLSQQLGLFSRDGSDDGRSY